MMPYNELAVLARDGGLSIRYSNGFFYKKDKSDLMSVEDVKINLLKLMEKPNSKKALELIDLIKTCQNVDVNVREIFINTLNLDRYKPDNLFQELFPNVRFLKNILYDIVFNKSERLYFMRGVPKAGKSRIMEFLSCIFKGFYKTKTIDKFNESFGGAGVDGSLLIFGDDLGAEHLDKVSSGKMKSMVTGEETAINRKFMEERDVKVQSNFIFGCNKPITYDYGDTGNHRRFCEVYFDTPLTWSKEQYRYYCSYIKEHCMEILAWVKTAENDDNESILHYLTTLTAVTKLRGIPREYEQYKAWCHKNGKKVANSETFGDLKAAMEYVDREVAKIPAWVIDYDKTKSNIQSQAIQRGETQQILGDGDLPF